MSTTSWNVASPLAGMQQIEDVSDTAKHKVGTIIRAIHPTYGAGEFVYLKGVASTVVGSVVTYNATDGTTSRVIPTTYIPQPVAVAMAATGASQYGWYQLSGQAIVAKAATVCLVAGVAASFLCTGRIAGAANGSELRGAVVMATASAASGRTTVQVLIDRPYIQGRVT